MGIYSRLQKNDRGEIFFPMNVDGFSYEENFMNSKKVVMLGIMLLVDLYIIVKMFTGNFGPIGVLLLLVFMLFIDQLVIRFGVFEERYFYKVYKNLQKNRITDLGVFWNIRRIQRYEDMSVLKYANNKIGILLELNRDTIIGRKDNFEEQHYGAVSDMIKELNKRGISWVIMSIMESAGNDPRIQRINKERQKSGNKNFGRLVDCMIGHVKKLIRSALYEKDYILVYRQAIGTNAEERLIADTKEAMDNLMGGAFTGYRSLKSKQVIELYKERYGVKYFSYNDAVIKMARNYGVKMDSSIKITGISNYNGEYAELTNEDIRKLREELYKESINQKSNIRTANRAGNRDMSIRNRKKSNKNETCVNNDDTEEFELITDFDIEIGGIEESGVIEREEVKKVSSKQSRFSRKSKKKNKESVEEEFTQLHDYEDEDEVEINEEDDIIDF